MHYLSLDCYWNVKVAFSGDCFSGIRILNAHPFMNQSSKYAIHQIVTYQCYHLPRRSGSSRLYYILTT